MAFADFLFEPGLSLRRRKKIREIEGAEEDRRRETCNKREHKEQGEEQESKKPLCPSPSSCRVSHSNFQSQFLHFKKMSMKIGEEQRRESILYNTTQDCHVEQGVT